MARKRSSRDKKLTGKRTTVRRAPTTSASPSAPAALREVLEPDEARVEGVPAPAPAVPVAGIGASAGGLEAFSQLLEALPDDAGHGDRARAAPRPAARERAAGAARRVTTSFPVVQATEGMRVEPSHVYVIPPNVQMGITDGVLHLAPRPSDRTQYTPIDFFLRSLADAAQDRADRRRALRHRVGRRRRRPRGQGGRRHHDRAGSRDARSTTACRAPRSRPAWSISCSRPREIAAELGDDRAPSRSRHARGERARPATSSALATRRRSCSASSRCCAASSGVDFRHYKLPTIQRRLQRRMALHKLTQLRPVRHATCRSTPPRCRRLYQDILIHVTRFFREPESFEALAEPGLPAHPRRARRGDAPIRVWVPGCSTGEEAYSVAIALLEYLGDRGRRRPDPDLRHRRQRERRSSTRAPASTRRASRPTCRPSGCAASSPRSTAATGSASRCATSASSRART